MKTTADSLRAELTDRDRAVLGLMFGALLATGGWGLVKLSDIGERVARIEGRLEHEDRRALAPPPATIPNPPPIAGGA